MRKLYPILFLVVLLPFNSFSQENEGLARILTTVLESSIIQPYLPHDSANHLNIHYLIAGRNVPTRIKIVINGRLIPITTEPDGLSGNLLRVAKLIWKDERAKVVLKGPGNFFARYKLYFEEDDWVIANAYLKGIAFRNGKKNKSWDYKF